MPSRQFLNLHLLPKKSKKQAFKKQYIINRLKVPFGHPKWLLTIGASPDEKLTN